MSKIRFIKDNAVLSIEKEELAQYEARGYNKLGATKKAASEELEKEIEKLTKANEKLTADNKELTKANEKLIADIEELKKNVK